MLSPDNGGENGANSEATKRMRWATQRVKSVGKASNKRGSIMRRFQKNNTVAEKKRVSAGTDSSTNSPPSGVLEGESSTGGDDASEDADLNARTIFFNQPLPSDQLDEKGHPRQQFARNKIRTARYTALSFIPKNLWYQFHNIANCYFLLLIILTVSDSDTLQAMFWS